MNLCLRRQGMFDDTYVHIPTQGWMFVPLTVYHGGGDAAQFEPLVAHQIEYEWALAQYLGSFLVPFISRYSLSYVNGDLGAGIAACYRGYRLYDTNETKALVTKWVAFYKKYRPILIRDIVHVGHRPRSIPSLLCPSRSVVRTCNRSIVTCTWIRMPARSKVTRRRL